MRIKLHSSKEQNSENNSFYPSRKEACMPSSQPSREADFLSLARKTEAQGFEVEGRFSCDPPVLTVPGAVCRWGWKWLSIMGAVFGPRTVNPAFH